MGFRTWDRGFPNLLVVLAHTGTVQGSGLGFRVVRFTASGVRRRRLYGGDKDERHRIVGLRIRERERFCEDTYYFEYFSCTTPKVPSIVDKIWLWAY